MTSRLFGVEKHFNESFRPSRTDPGGGLLGHPLEIAGTNQRFGLSEIFEFYASSEGNTGFMNLFNRDCTIGMAITPPALVEYNIHEDN